MVRIIADVRSHVISAPRRWIVECAAVVVVSLALVWLVRNGLDKYALADALWLFYLPAWFIVLALFGGIHGAPGWSELPVFIISFTLQNLVLWYAAKWVVRLARSTARET